MVVCFTCSVFFVLFNNGLIKLGNFSSSVGLFGRDDAETALYREIKDLQNNIRRLQDAGLATQRAAERLAAAKASLDEDIERKMTALHIDEVRVRGARTGIDLEEF